MTNTATEAGTADTTEDATKVTETSEEVKSDEVSDQETGEADDQGSETAGETATDESKGKTFTQEEVNGLVAAEKRKQTAKLSNLESELAQLKESSASALEENETLKLQVAEKDKTILKQKLAIEARVSPDIFDKIKGDTEEELKESLQYLKSTLAGDGTDFWNNHDKEYGTPEPDDSSEMLGWIKHNR